MTKNSQGSIEIKDCNLQKKPVRVSSDFLGENLQDRREWKETFKIVREEPSAKDNIYPAELSFRYKGEVNGFPDKQKLKEFATMTPPLQEMLKGPLLLETERQNYNKL